MKKKVAFVLLCLFFFSCTKNDSGNDPDFLKRWSEWVYEGDSITDVNAFSFNYPNQLQKYYNNIAISTQLNVAKSGDQMFSIIGEYATEIHPHRPAAKGLGIFLLMAGTNDATSQRTSSQVYNDLKTEWAFARSDGFTVVAMCITRSTVASRDTLATAVNKLIVSDNTLYDYLVRTDLLLPDPADLSLFIDGVHPSANGSKKIADEIVRVLTP